MKEHNEFDDLDEEYETISIIDDDGNEIDFVVISSIKHGDFNYLLVLEGDLLDDDEAEASILKEIAEDGQDLIYVPVEENEEFLELVKLFQENNDEYDIEI